MEKKSRKTRKQSSSTSKVTEDIAVKSEPVTQMLSAINQFLDEQGMEYYPPRLSTSSKGYETFIIETEFPMDNGTFKIYLRNSGEKGACLMCHCVSTLSVPSKRRLEVSELITRLNYDQIIGNLEMDFRDGELRFKTSLDCEGTPLTDALLRGLLFRCIACMNHYQPAIESVVIGEATPKEADALILLSEQ